MLRELASSARVALLASIVESPARAACRTRRISAVLLGGIAIVALTAVGCSGSKGPQRFEVSGTVKLDGQPVPKGLLALVPDSNTQGPTVGGEIIDGKYLIPKAKGPIAGDYIFQFTGMSDKPSGEIMEIKGGVKQALMLPVFPHKYGDASKEVRKIGPDSTKFDFELKSD